MVDKINVYYDAEFLEDGRVVDLVSIGFQDERSATYYAVNADMPIDQIRQHDWLCKNVVPHLPLTNKAQVDEWVKQATTPVTETAKTTTSLKKAAGVVMPPPFSPTNPMMFELDRTSVLVRPKWVIANEVREWLGNRAPIELWSWYSAHDHVVLHQLWGPMVARPPHVPMRTHDLGELQDELGLMDSELPQPEPGQNHDALADAKRHRRIHEFLKAEKKRRKL